MGALRNSIALTDSYGNMDNANISQFYIWRSTELVFADDVLEYTVTRVPPALVDINLVKTLVDEGEEMIITPHAKFMHKYSDGAELCVARALIALQEAGI